MLAFRWRIHEHYCWWSRRAVTPTPESCNDQVAIQTFGISPSCDSQKQSICQACVRKKPSKSRSDMSLECPASCLMCQWHCRRVSEVSKEDPVGGQWRGPIGWHRPSGRRSGIASGVPSGVYKPYSGLRTPAWDSLVSPEPTLRSSWVRSPPADQPPTVCDWSSTGWGCADGGWGNTHTLSTSSSPNRASPLRRR